MGACHPKVTKKVSSIVQQVCKKYMYYMPIPCTTKEDDGDGLLQRHMVQTIFSEHIKQLSKH